MRDVVRFGGKCASMFEAVGGDHLRRTLRVAGFRRVLEPPRAVAGRGAGSPSSDSICSMLGRLVSSWAGSACTSWYSATPIGLLVSRRAYSATTLSMLLHNKR